MKKIIIPVVILLFFSCIVVSAIGGGYLYYQSKAPARAYDKATSQMKNLKTAEFDMDMTADYEIKFVSPYDSANKEYDLKSNGEGIVDYENEKMKLEMNTSVLGQNSTVNVIIIKDKVYIKSSPSDKYEEYTMETLKEMNVTATTLEDLEKTQIWGMVTDEWKYKYIEEEEIDGVEMYKYEVTISEKEKSDYIDYFKESLIKGMNSTGSVLEIDEDDIEVEDITYYVWVRKDNSMPYKEELTMGKVTIDFGEYGKMYVTDIINKSVYKSVNEEVKIEKP